MAAAKWEDLMKRRDFLTGAVTGAVVAAGATYAATSNRTPAPIEPGTHTSLVQMPYAQFRGLLGGTILSVPFSRPAAALIGDRQTLYDAGEQFTPARVKRDVDEFHELPALPATAAQILQLAADPRANARQLAEIIEQKSWNVEQATELLDLLSK